MKKIILITIAAMVCVFSNTYSQQAAAVQSKQAETKAKANGPVASFDKTVYEFGDLVQSSPGTASFVLSNDGNEPLIISSATASCGCTNLSYSKEPILPGKSVSISATYNAAVLGNFIKTVTVRTNAGEQPVVLQLKGNVVAKS